MPPVNRMIPSGYNRSLEVDGGNESVGAGALRMRLILESSGAVPWLEDHLIDGRRPGSVVHGMENLIRTCLLRLCRGHRAVTTTQLTQRSLVSFAEHSGPSHLLECGSGLHEVCHSCPEFFGTGHGLSFGWDEADISTEIDGEGSEVGDIVGRGPASDHAVATAAAWEKRFPGAPFRVWR